jgi:hypothetical protein
MLITSSHVLRYILLLLTYGQLGLALMIKEMQALLSADGWETNKRRVAI